MQGPARSWVGLTLQILGRASMCDCLSGTCMRGLTGRGRPPWSKLVKLVYASAGEAEALLEVGEYRFVTLPLSGGPSMGAPALLVCHDGFFR